MTLAIDSLGKVIGLLDEWNKPGVLIVQVPLHQFSTLYTFWGDRGDYFHFNYFVYTLFNDQSKIVEPI